MKQFISGLFLLAFFSVAEAQTGKDSLSMIERLNQFIRASEKMDFAAVMDLTHPKLFTLAPKETMIEMMSQAFKDTSTVIGLDSLRVGKISHIISEGNNYYAKIGYSNIMTLVIKDETGGSSFSEDALKMIKITFGQRNVRWDDQHKRYVIAQKKNIAAIKDEQSVQWVFIEFKPDDPMMTTFLSDEMIEKLKAL